MKHTFIYMSLCSVLLFLGGCSNESEIDNRVDNLRTPLTIRAVASYFENQPAGEGLSTRTPNENGLNTSFQTGDAIGISGLKRQCNSRRYQQHPTNLQRNFRQYRHLDAG